MRTTLFFLAIAAIAATSDAQDDENNRRDLWADRMAQFAEQDQEHPAPSGGVVFVGSSSIRLWDLEKSFPEMQPKPLNRGFGGSQLVDSIQRAEELVLKHKPRLVLVYAGDNDIAAGKDAPRVVNDFRKLASLVKQHLPEVQIAYIAIKPSIARWNLQETMADANHQIAERCGSDEQLTFVDVWLPMLGDDGKPRPELFRDDGLHLNDKGYQLWTSLVAPVIESARTTRE